MGGSLYRDPQYTRAMEGIPARNESIGSLAGGENVSAGSALVPQDELHAAYALACTKANQPIVTKQMFGRTLRRLRPELREAQRTIAGRRQWVYLGMGMKASPVETLKRVEETLLERRCSLDSLHQRDLLGGDMEDTNQTE